MAGSHKKQHTIPRSYLAAWVEPVTPPGQTSAIYLISKEDKSVRRKSPEKSFTQTDRYTVRLKDGSRDLTVEHALGSIENDFQAVLRAIRQGQRLNPLQKAKVCTFTAAMMSRSKQQGDWILKQRLEHLEQIKDMEKTHGVDPIASLEMEEALQNHHAQLVVNGIEVIAPVLYQMTLTIFTTTNRTGFITSDAPAVMYNPKAHTFPPMYRSAGLLQKDVEVTLPLSPQHMVLFSHRPSSQLYIPIGVNDVDEANRTTYFFCESEFVSRTGEVRDAWVTEREKPADAWNEEAAPNFDVEGPMTVEQVVNQYEQLKEFHDGWKGEIFVKDA
jgi:hypothetical protein